MFDFMPNTDLDWLASLDQGSQAFLIVFLIMATTVTAVVPTSSFNLAAGAFFGAIPGGLLTCLGCTLGSVVNFFAGRYLVRDWARKKLEASPMMAALDRALERRALFMITLSRLSPVFPFGVLSYTLGATAVRIQDFVVGTAGGVLPGVCLYDTCVIRCCFLFCFKRGLSLYLIFCYCGQVVFYTPGWSMVYFLCILFFLFILSVHICLR